MKVMKKASSPTVISHVLIHRLILFVALAIFTIIPITTIAQEVSDSVLANPVTHGAWLWGSYCVRCHGLYGEQRVGEALNKKELKAAIEGAGRPSCQIAWSRSRGGPLGSKEINALVAYVTEWLERGAEPDVPVLPAFATATPQPSTAPKTQKSFVTPIPMPTATPTPPPEIRMIIEGSEVAKGGYLYTINCHRCHLSYGYARIGLGLDPKTIKRTIENGKVGTTMPAMGWRQGGPLRSQDIAAIVAYITAFERLGESPALPSAMFVPPTPDPARLLPTLPLFVPIVQGHSRNGLALYAQHCTGCHGEDGQGSIGPNLVKDWLSVRPDLTIRSTIVRGVPGAPMPAWHKAEGGSLSDEQIADLVVLLLEQSFTIK